MFITSKQDVSGRVYKQLRAAAPHTTKHQKKHNRIDKIEKRRSKKKTRSCVWRPFFENKILNRLHCLVACLFTHLLAHSLACSKLWNWNGSSKNIKKCSKLKRKSSTLSCCYIRWIGSNLPPSVNRSLSLSAEPVVMLLTHFGSVCHHL